MPGFQCWMTDEYGDGERPDAPFESGFGHGPRAARSAAVSFAEYYYDLEFTRPQDEVEVSVLEVDTGILRIFTVEAECEWHFSAHENVAATPAPGKAP